MLFEIRLDGRQVVARGRKVENAIEYQESRGSSDGRGTLKVDGREHDNRVTIALRERLYRLRQQQGLGLADRLLAIGKDCAARLREPFRSADHGEILYDERGLPR